MADTHGPEVYIPKDKLPRLKQAAMGDTSWTHCGYCCKILVATYLHGLKGTNKDAKWTQGVDVGQMMKGSGYAFGDYAIAAEVSDSGTVLRKSGAEQALKLVDEYLSMDPPLPLVCGVDHKAGTANQGKDIDHFVLIVGRKYKDGQVIYPLHDVGGGDEKYFVIKDGVLYKEGRDYRKDPGGAVAARRYVVTAVARYQPDGSPPAPTGAVVVEAHTAESGQPTEAPPHTVDNPLASRLKNVPDLVKMAVQGGFALKQKSPYTDAVKAMQEALNTVQSAGLDTDGKYGPGTGRAVQTFQETTIATWKKIGAADKLTGFGADGLCGRRTLMALDAALALAEGVVVEHDGTGTPVELDEPCSTPPSTAEEKAYADFKAAILKSGKFSDKTWDMNVLGIRGFLDGQRVPNELDAFNDTIALVYKCDQGHKHAAQFRASVDPGSNVDGTPDIHLEDGQYDYVAGDWAGTPCLKPKGNVKVWMDTAEDGTRHPDDPLKEGQYDICIIPNESGEMVGDFGGGLQLIAGGKDQGSPWKKFWKLAQRDPEKEYRYTLLDGANIPGQDPLQSKPTAEAPPPVTEPDKAPPPVPGTPPPITAEGLPQVTEPQFAPATGRYWPIITKLKQGRAVAYKTTDGKVISNSGRRFLALRSNGARYHVGIDLWGDLGDPVVACEDGKIASWYHFYEGVWALIVQNDSGTVINYGEVDKSSLSKLGLKKGDRVKAGQQIGIVGKMKVDSMCHFEMYTNGTTENHRWMVGEKRPPELLNPTAYLLALATGQAAAATEPAPDDGKAACGYCHKLQEMIDDGTISDKVKKGGKDKTAVMALQAHLVTFGYNLGKGGPDSDGVDGDYGGKTRDASKAFIGEVLEVADADPDTLTASEAKLVIEQCALKFHTKGGIYTEPPPPPVSGGSSGTYKINRVNPGWNKKHTIWLEGGLHIPGSMKIPVPTGTTEPREVILTVITAVETATYDDMNIYDRGILSWSINQWTLHADSLQKRLRMMKKEQPGLFKRLFQDRGVDVGTKEMEIVLNGKMCKTQEEIREIVKGDKNGRPTDDTTPWTESAYERMEYWAKLFVDAARDSESQVYQRFLAVNQYEQESFKKNLDNYSWAGAGYGKLAQYMSENLLLQAMYCGLYVNNPTQSMKVFKYTIDHFRGQNGGEQDPQKWASGWRDQIGAKYIELGKSRGLDNWPERLDKQKKRYDEVVAGRSLRGVVLV